MADELTLNSSISFSKSGRNPSRSKQIKVDVTGEKFVHGEAEIGTSPEDLSAFLAELGTLGYAWFYNHDATNYIQIGHHNGGSPVYFARLKPGELIGPIRLDISASNLKFLANTAGCDLEYFIVED